MSEPTEEPGAPTGPAVQVADPARKGRLIIIFAVLAAVFLLAAGAMTVLYIKDTRAAEKVIADQKAQIASLQSDLAARNDEATKAKADLDKATKDLAAAKADAEKNAACSQAVKDFFAALKANDDAKGEAAVVTMASACGASLI